MAFEHVFVQQHAPGELFVVLGVLDAHADEGGDVFAELAAVDARRVAGDHPLLLQLAHALGDGGLRQPYGAGDLGLRHPRVALQEVDDFIIYRIKHLTAYTFKRILLTGL